MQKLSKNIFKNSKKNLGIFFNRIDQKIISNNTRLYVTSSNIIKCKNNTNVNKYQNNQIMNIKKRNYNNDLFTVRNSQEFLDSLKKSLSILSKSGSWSYTEAWVPNAEENKLTRCDSWSSDKKYAADQVSEIAVKGGSGPVFEAFNTKKPIQLQSLKNIQKLANAGLNNGVVLPILTKEGKVIAILSFYSAEARDIARDVESLNPLAPGLVGSGIASIRKSGVFFQNTGDVNETQLVDVFNRIVDTGVFNTNVVYEEVYKFYNELGFPKDYFKRFGAEELANYIHTYIAAKKVAETLGKPEEIMMETIHNNKRLYFCPNDEESVKIVERKIENSIKSLPKGSTYSVRVWCSTGSPVFGGKKKIAFYEFSQEEFLTPNVSEEETGLNKLATQSFIEEKSPNVKERYQSLLETAKGKQSPRYGINIGNETANLIIMLRTNDSFLSYFSQLVSSDSELSWNRKFVENFSNGLTSYSLYFKYNKNLENSVIESKLQSLAHQLGLLSILPQETRITHMFTNKTFSVEEYTYAMSVSRFVYYFMNNKSEEYAMLVKYIKNDPVNLGRLETMHNRLRSAAVSPARIQECITTYPEIIRELYEDFKSLRVPGRVVQGQSPKFNEELAKKINKTVSSDIDEVILGGFLRFNEHCLKTNFFKPNKSALSFRMGQGILQKGDVNEVPFGIFWVMGTDFQGFHVRLRDVARGGIRMIVSQNDSIYNKNADTQFQENYNLAATQNKKNKDIPEFGSKGTILLYRSRSKNTNVDTFLPFKKYVAGLLDLLCESDRVWYNDFYGSPEVLFLGPDEGTATYMQWAAEYAKRRGYRFWQAFTTGKPPSMGGIPHDIFGMTTRSVHSNVLGCLKKSGLKEEEVTKLQTGGPDGDLGSNEILISKDKTIAIVDGSGVLYDPEGINRPQLEILANNREMINKFDKSYLGPKGFKVLLDDVNVKLPNGEVVENGRKFRDEFHLLPYSSADLFVPCGGRPGAVNLNNVHRLLNEDGTPRFKFIVEGANLFFTQDARQVLEKAGVVLYKDASANKGGVTSSSLEVLAALSMKEEEFAKHMMVSDINNPSPFYSNYVKEIQEIVSKNAELEFEAIWREHERTGTPRFLLTDIISDKINSLNDMINQSTLYENYELKCKVLLTALPKTLVSTIGLTEIMRKVPDNYLRAIFSANLASTYIYKYGIDAPEICFFEFMQALFPSPK
eukprot:TRINITY_DN1181_c0_g1_i1.p1 TRINITY_DN1181_c0_g1~~TRINITY_DN1181_c0_g1_i1.p1  ORF type:complete len:1199 (-),score=411.69 TRINITY_DN1181_c0_g1_i1:74-3670(-)